MIETKQNLFNKQHQTIKGCIAGNRTCQSELYHLYANKMMGVCMWYAKNREEAEEILQDGFIRVFKYMHTLNDDGNLEAWIRKIMVNAALFKYRNKSAYLKLVTEFNPEIHDISIDAQFVSRFDEKELVKLVQTLPYAYRLVFNLYVFEGLKHREIAMMLNISEGTSKSNLSDARKILQSALKSSQKLISS